MNRVFNHTAAAGNTETDRQEMCCKRKTRSEKRRKDSAELQSQ